MKIKKINKNLYVEDDLKNGEERDPKALLLSYTDNNEEYYKSDEYGKLVKVDELKPLLDKMDMGTPKYMIKNYLEIRSIWKKKKEWGDRFFKKWLFLVSMGISMSIILSLFKPIVPGLDIWNVGVAVVIIGGVLAWLVNSTKNEIRYKKMEDIVKETKSFARDWYGIKDKNGDKIKAIWFLYHNLDFKNEREREDYLRLNYRKYNGYFNMEFFDASFSRFNIDFQYVVSDYLSYVLEVKNQELENERERAKNLLLKNQEENISLTDSSVNWW